ncbi:MAG: hypothetical protein ACR2LT_07965 [Pyrinomonadaceae bacterium]
MKKFSSLLCILIIALYFGTTEVPAQKTIKAREIIIVEVSISGYETDRREVPINRTSHSKYEIGGGGGCGECYAEQPDDYLYTARAFRMGKNKVNVGFQIAEGMDSDDKCKTQKIFAVYRNQKTKVKLRCGVNLIAYYGFETERAN